MLRKASVPRMEPYVSFVVVGMGEGVSGLSERERSSDIEMLAAQVSAMLYLAWVSYLSIHWTVCQGWIGCEWKILWRSLG